MQKAIPIIPVSNEFNFADYSKLFGIKFIMPRVRRASSVYPLAGTTPASPHNETRRYNRSNAAIKAVIRKKPGRKKDRDSRRAAEDEIKKARGRASNQSGAGVFIRAACHNFAGISGGVAEFSVALECARAAPLKRRPPPRFAALYYRRRDVKGGTRRYYFR